MKRIISLFYVLFSKHYVLIVPENGSISDLSNADYIDRLDMIYRLEEKLMKRWDDITSDDIQQELNVLSAYEIINNFKLDQ